MTSRSFDAEAGVQRILQVRKPADRRGIQDSWRIEFHFFDSKGSISEGVVAHSSGNHAQAVAIAAQYAGIPATLVMPEDAPRAKMEGTRARGAKIVTYDRFTGNREAISRQSRRKPARRWFPRTIIRGPSRGRGPPPGIDGGGPGSGCAGGVLWRRGTDVGVGDRWASFASATADFGIEPELANDTFLSFAAGKRVKIETPPTIADGLRSTTPGDLTFPILQKHVEQMITVSDDEIRADAEVHATAIEDSGGAERSGIGGRGDV